MSEKPVVLITGFGPFGEFRKNASWEVAKTVSELGIEGELGIRLITKEIEVSYPTVSTIVPQLWYTYKPILVIHLGVSALATKIIIESCAHKQGYNRCDVNGELPLKGECCLGSCENIKQQLDLALLAQSVNNLTENVVVEISNNAGRYLCEFIYYTSLCINDKCTLFVHVPDIDQPYSVEQMAEGVKLIISSALSQIQRLQMSKTCEQISTQASL